MKGRTVILDHLEGREAAALLADGQLDDFLIQADAPAPGTIYRARADRPVKGQGGVFVTTPDGPAFLRQVKGLSPGQFLLVQVTGYPEAGKAMPVTQKILFKSRYAIVTPGAPGINISRNIRDEDERDRLLEVAHDTVWGDTGLILRSACAQANAEDVASDITAMADLAMAVMNDAEGAPERLVDGDAPHALAWREWSDPADIVTDPGGFETHGVLDMLDETRGARVSIGAGGYFFVEPTRALLAIDVNTGRDTSLAAGLKANLGVARALPRILRVRGLGGQITLDLAPMAKKDRRSFETALRAAFRFDPEETALLGWTPSGHYELQRKRGRIPLHEVLT
ncbi:MAG: ribonuclease E/G [Pseudomonadota bacterium]